MKNTFYDYIYISPILVVLLVSNDFILPVLQIQLQILENYSIASHMEKST